MSLDNILSSNPSTVTLSSRSKNLIIYPYKETSKTVSGITFNVKSDGHIEVSGTATADVTFVIQDNITLTAGEVYTLSGFYSGYNSATLVVSDSTNTQTKTINTVHQTSTFTASYTNYSVYLSIVSGNAIEGDVFFPQLEKGIGATAYSINYGDREVNKVYYSTRNLIVPSTAATQKITGVTFTNNSDGTITVDGTATANSTYNLGSILIPRNRTLTLSGCPTDGSTSTYLLYVYDSGTNSSYSDTGNGVTFNTQSTIVTLYIRVFNGYNITNKVFRPQLELGSKKTSYVAHSVQTMWEKASS